MIADGIDFSRHGDHTVEVKATSDAKGTVIVHEIKVHERECKCLYCDQCLHPNKKD